MKQLLRKSATYRKSNLAAQTRRLPVLQIGSSRSIGIIKRPTNNNVQLQKCSSSLIKMNAHYNSLAGLRNPVSNASHHTQRVHVNSVSVLRQNALSRRSLSTSKTSRGHNVFDIKARLDTSKNIFKLQDKVPRLPIPNLNDTLDRYIEYVEPLLSADQLSRTKDLVSDFRKTEGPYLQEKLKLVDQETQTFNPNSSWLSGWWETMYLTIREPLMITTTPFLILQKDTRRTGQAERAAHLLATCVRHAQKVWSGSLEPDMEKTAPLDMFQHARLFGSARIPRPGRDEMITYQGVRHATVISRNQVFVVDVVDAQGRAIPEENLIFALNNILERSKVQKYPPLPALTAGGRDNWASVRAHMIQNPQNKQSLELIDTSLAVISLEEFAPKDLAEASPMILHRDGTNRWYDKFAIVVFQNGLAGSLLEHSPVDGHTALRLLSDYGATRDSDPVAASAADSGEAKVRALEWEVDETVSKGLETAMKEADSWIVKTQSKVVLPDFGKKEIIKNSFSPDAFVQMAYQLAYWKLYGRCDSTYESCNTKNFLGGRTETIRSVTNESAAFTRAWTDPNVAPAHKIELLRAATQKHVTRAGEAKQGQGVDRHLWGLSKLAHQMQDRYHGYNVHPIFKDPALAKLMTSVISTSNVSAPVFDLFGFGPVVENGLGLAYNIHDHRMMFNVTSYQGEAVKFGNMLHDTLNEMKATADNLHQNHSHCADPFVSGQKRQYHSSAMRMADQMNLQEFHESADTILHHIEEVVSDLLYDTFPDLDIEYSSGVLQMKIGKGPTGRSFGTYAINKQPPNKEIWWSSPISGAKRFSRKNGKWLDIDDPESELCQLLESELSDISGSNLKDIFSRE